MNSPNWPVPKTKPDSVDFHGWLPILGVLAVWWGAEWVISLV